MKVNGRTLITERQLNMLYSATHSSKGMGRHQVKFKLTFDRGPNSIFTELGQRPRSFDDTVEVDLRCDPGCVPFQLRRELARMCGMKIVEVLPEAAEESGIESEDH